MTGRDLIIYILENHLENEPIIDGGKFIGFMTIDEAAALFDVGSQTIKVWIAMNQLKSVKIGETIYIPKNAADPRLSAVNVYING